MRTLNYKNFIQITIPDNWTVEENNDLLSFYSTPNGVGALQMSFINVTKDNIDVDKELVSITENRIRESGLEGKDINTNYYRLNSFAISEMEYTIDDNYWRNWFFIKDKKMIFITYNCLKTNHEVEFNDVQKIISSIKSNY